MKIPKHKLPSANLGMKTTLVGANQLILYIDPSMSNVLTKFQSDLTFELKIMLVFII